MPAISETFDVKIRVVFPFLTKSLSDDDSSAINATGNFNFNPPPQVSTVSSQISENIVKEQTTKQRKERVREGLTGLLDDFDKIFRAMRERAQHIVLTYDPELAQNEALADAEEKIFGAASGRITYDMFEQVLEFQSKVDKYISHSSIENGGTIDSVA